MDESMIFPGGKATERPAEEPTDQHDGGSSMSAGEPGP